MTKIVIPYVNDNEILELREALFGLPVVFWKDTHRIGSDLAYQTLWHKYPKDDIIILHADMLPMPNDKYNEWYYDLINYANKYPEAGIFGTTLLYPAKDDNDNYYIQHAGGRFENGEAIHFGGGLELFSARTVRSLESDTRKYDRLREVAWVTFGGVYIRRTVLDSLPTFDPSYFWTYYRDVDYCLAASKLGYKIYQTPIQLLHFEGRDNKRLMSPDKREQMDLNYRIFIEKWGSDLEKYNIDRVVDEKETNIKESAT